MNDIYLGPKYERVNRLAEWESPLVEYESDFKNFLSEKNPGCFGWGSDMSLHNIGTTVDMLGRSSGLCCTHNRLIWIDRTTSEKLNDSTSDMSISSKDLPSLWRLHACTIRSHFVTNYCIMTLRDEETLFWHKKMYINRTFGGIFDIRSRIALLFLKLTCPRRLRLWSPW